MNEDKLKRINELARKSKAEGLTEAERAERQTCAESILKRCV